MKKLLVALVILACPSLLQADLIQNGDFSAGSANWQGDGQTPQQYAQDHPGASTGTFASKGFIVTLDPKAWTRIFQLFPGDNGTRYSITITYIVSPDLTVSKDPADYEHVGGDLHVPGYDRFSGIKPKAHQIGQLLGSVGDPNGRKVCFEWFQPKNQGADKPQTYRHTYPTLPPLGEKTVIVAFPPGSGSVVLLNVGVTSQ